MSDAAALPPPQTLQGMLRMPVVQQLLILIGIAAAVAIGVAAVMWSRGPEFQPLYAGLSDKDLGLVTEALQKSGIVYRIEGAGSVQVSADKVSEARMQLAGQGLPHGSDATGFEMLENAPQFGTSQFMEAARYHRALENELARSIGSLASVSSARVHLAIPKPSVFVRNRQPPSASVLVNLYSGRNIDDSQVAGIVHLVASSVPNLEPEKVTVIDQKGRMLSSGDQTREAAATARQFDHTRKLEETYVRRIEELLSPIIGREAIRAEVTADVDYTVTETAQEKYNPDQPALRSEQTATETSSHGGAVAGIPGALSNQPPGVATAPEQTAAKPAVGKDGKPVNSAEAPPATPQSQSARATRNFELDKVVSHTQLSSGNIRRLSVAVILDDAVSTDEEGEVVRTPRKPEDIGRITSLVKEAVGFSEARGDTVSVVNAGFVQAAVVAEEVEAAPFWKEAWVWSVGKQVMGGLAVLLVILMVIRPAMKGLLSRHAVVAEAEAAATVSSLHAMAGSGMLPGGGNPQALGAPPGYEANLTAAKQLTQQDPKRVAQVVKNWVGTDG